MDHVISPVNITAAALMMQISIVIIMAVGVGISAMLTDFRLKGGAPWILLLAIITVVLLVLSDEFSSVWRPLFGAVSFDGLSWSTTLFLVFILDIMALALLVWFTGGSLLSALTPLYFVLPPLAIFLREPVGRVWFYAILISVMFTLNLGSEHRYEWEDQRAARGVGYWVVSILCFVLATWIGIMTRPAY